MVEAATSFRKNGFNDEDSATLAQVSSMFQNVADEAVSASDSAGFIISQLIAFNKTADEAINIVNEINAVSNSFSVSSADLSKALGIVASTSSSMGNSMEETLGLVTSITEQTRNASKSARSVNTILSRLSQVVDENSDTGKALTQIYNDLGIALFDSSGQMRDTYDILKDLSGQWDSLDRNTQNYIALTSAGSNQLNAFLALMNGFDHAVSATETALNSAGSATKENAKYMESLDAKAAQLKASFQELANNVIQSELVKSLLELANTFLKVADTGIGRFIIQYGLLTGALTAGISLFARYGRALSTTFSLLATFAKNITTTGSVIQGVTTTFSGLAAGATGAAGAFKALTAAAGPVALVLAGVVAAFTVGKAIYDKVNVSLEEQKEIVSNLTGEIENLRSEYDQLSSKDDLTDKEKQKLEILEAQIKANETILRQEKIKAYKKEFSAGSEYGIFDKEFWTESQKYQGKTGLQRVSTQVEDLKSLQKDLDYSQDLIGKYYQQIEKTTDEHQKRQIQVWIEEKKAHIETIQEQYNEINNEVATKVEELSDYLDQGIVPANAQSMVKGIVNSYLDFIGTEEEATEAANTLEAQLRKIADVEIMPKDAKSMNSWLESLTDDEFTKLQDLMGLSDGVAQKLSDTLSNMGGEEAINFINDAYKRFYGTIDDATEATDNFKKALETDYTAGLSDMLQMIDYIEQSEKNGVKNAKAYDYALEAVYGTADKGQREMIDKQLSVNNAWHKGTTALENFKAYFSDEEFLGKKFYDNLVDISQKMPDLLQISGSMDTGDLKIAIDDYSELAKVLGLTETSLNTMFTTAEMWGNVDIAEPVDAATRAMQELADRVDEVQSKVGYLIAQSGVGASVSLDVKIDESKLEEAENLINDTFGQLTGVKVDFDLSQPEEAARQMKEYLSDLQAYVSDEGHWDFSALTDKLSESVLQGVTISEDGISFESKEAAQRFVDGFVGNLKGTNAGDALLVNFLANMDVKSSDEVKVKSDEIVQVINDNIKNKTIVPTIDVAANGVLDESKSEIDKLTKKVEDTKKSVENLNESKLTQLGSQTDESKKKFDKLDDSIDKVRTNLNKLTKKRYVVSVTANYSGANSINGVPIVPANANGRDEQGQPMRASSTHKALVGEEGPEYRISADGKQELLGKNGPEITTVHKGDTIIPANATEMIRNGSLQQHKSGLVQVGKPTGNYQFKGATSANANIYANWSNVALPDVKSAYSGEVIYGDKSTKSKKKNTKANKDNTSATKANSKAKTENANSSNKVKTAAEELSDKLKEQKEAFDDLNDVTEHNIYIREKQGASNEELIKLNKDYQKQLHEQANQLRSMGATTENSSALRETQKSWWSLQDTIEKLEDDIIKDQQDAFKKRLQISKDYIDDRNDLDDWGADSEVEAWKRVLKWMEEWYKEGKIDYETYLDARKDATKKEAAAEKAEWEAVHQAQIDAMEQEQDDLETLFGMIADEAQERIDALNKKRDEEEAFWDAKIDEIESANDALQDQIDLEEALDRVARAKQTKVMVYKDGRYQYINDLDEVSDAQANLDKLQREKAMQQEVDDLKKRKDEALKAIDEEIEGWEEYQKKWSNMASNIQKTNKEMEVAQKYHIDTEKQNWDLSIGNLNNYVSQYESLMARLAAAKEMSYQGYMNGEMMSVPTGGLSKSEKANLDNYAAGGGDLAAWIKGSNGYASKEALEYANKLRNEKIDKEGITGQYGQKYGSASDLLASMGYGNKSTSSYRGTSSGSSGKGSGGSKSSGSKPSSAIASGIKSALSSVGKLLSGKGFKKNANGTENFEGGLSLVGEEGAELRVLNRGDGIIPADITKNLWQWGAMTPADMMSNVGDLDLNSKNDGTFITIQNFNPNLSNVKDGEGFAQYMKNNFMREVVQFQTKK